MAALPIFIGYYSVSSKLFRSVPITNLVHGLPNGSQCPPLGWIKCWKTINNSIAEEHRRVFKNHSGQLYSLFSVLFYSTSVHHRACCSRSPIPVLVLLSGFISPNVSLPAYPLVTITRLLICDAHKVNDCFVRWHLVDCIAEFI